MTPCFISEMPGEKTKALLVGFYQKAWTHDASPLIGGFPAGQIAYVQVPLCYLAKSLENMSLCHAAYFCKGWENARGCRIEHDAAVAYGLEVLYED